MIASLCQGATLPPAASGTDMQSLFLLLAGLSLAPFVLTVATSFAKLVIVGSLLRQALGTNQVPPNSVLTGLAFVLTIPIMAPVAGRVVTAARASDGTPKGIALAVSKPLAEHLQHRVDAADRELLRTWREQLGAGKGVPEWVGDCAPIYEVLTVDAPAFVLKELAEAFQIGFLIFLPFLVIDLVLANVLMALGMSSLQQTTVAIPLKLVVFWSVDGWERLLGGIVRSYAS